MTDRLLHAYDPDSSDPVYQTQARVSLIRANERGVTDLSLEDLSALARQRAPDPSVFDDRPPFFWGAQISSTELDSYFTHMSPKTSLRNFAQDATAGVSFQNSHVYRSLGFGYSLQGKFFGAQGNGVARTVADFYTIRGLKLNDVGTDDLIEGMRAGIIRDVSVGFGGPDLMFMCDLCGKDMMRDYTCPHIPGFRYDPDKPDDWHTDPNGTLATATVENARLSEVSAVFDGSTPGAAVVKAFAEADRGRMLTPQRQILEARYRIHLPAPRMQVSGVRVQNPAIDLQTVQEDSMALPDLSTPPATITSTPDGTAIRAALQAAGITTDDLLMGVQAVIAERARLIPYESEVATLRAQVAEVTTLRAQVAEAAGLPALKEEVERLRPLAREVLELRPLVDQVAGMRLLVTELETSRPLIADGKQYRADLIAEALAEGTRANGEGFEEATYRTLLETPGLPLATIKRMSADWKRQADLKFPAGNQTHRADDRGPTPEPAPEQPAIPNAAYAS